MKVFKEVLKESPGIDTVTVQMTAAEADALKKSIQYCISHVDYEHKDGTAASARVLLHELGHVLYQPKKREINWKVAEDVAINPVVKPPTTPAVGKRKDTSTAPYMVEVVLNNTNTRSLARRFETKELAEDFHDRTVKAHQAKAAREDKHYVVHLYEMGGPRRAHVLKAHRSTEVDP